jgi:hypothetical protein
MADAAPQPYLLSHPQPIPTRIRIDLDQDPHHGDAQRLAAADRLEFDETGAFQLRQRAREVGLRPSVHLRQIGG